MSNSGFDWRSDGACALTAWGLVIEVWVLSAWSMELPQRRYDPHHRTTGAVSKNATCDGYGG